MTSAHTLPDGINLLSPLQARQRLGVSRRTMQRYVADGLIAPVGRLPNGHARFSPTDVDALISDIGVRDERATA